MSTQTPTYDDTVLLTPGTSKWPEILEGADQRIRQAEGELRRLTAASAIELARDEFRAGEDDLAEVDVLAERMLQALARIDAHRLRLMEIAQSCGGRIDGRDVTTDGRLDQLRDLLAQHPDFSPPRARTLTPLRGENPTVWRGRDGGWVGAGHGSDSFHDEQPERLEPRR
jgi:hypothetical protein